MRLTRFFWAFRPSFLLPYPSVDGEEGKLVNCGTFHSHVGATTTEGSEDDDVLGASIHDVLKNFGFFDPLPLVHIGQLIYSIKFTQPACLCLLFNDPPAPSRGDVIDGCPLTLIIILSLSFSISAPRSQHVFTAT